MGKAVLLMLCKVICRNVPKDMGGRNIKVACKNSMEISQYGLAVNCIKGLYSGKLMAYPTGQKYSLELMFAKFATAEIAKDLNPLKVASTRLFVPAYNTRVV